MIKSHLHLVQNDIIHKNDILSIIDINGNYYKRYTNYPKTIEPIQHKINIINHKSNSIYTSSKLYINSTLCRDNSHDLVVIMLREKPRTFHHHIYKVKNSILTYENNKSWYQN